MRLTGWVAGGVGLAALYCLFQLIIGPRFLLRRASGEEQDGNSHELLTWAQNHQGRALWKQNQYFDVYEQVLGQFRNRPNITLLQIGVHTGGAIDLWQQYFGKGFVFVGVDINPECAQFDNGKDVRIHIGSQSNSSFLTQVAKEIPKLDIVIDDGAHFSDISISTFTLLWPYLSPTQGNLFAFNFS
ncbi:hypothetical protein BASA81_002121 [Batrachochytrium salamandrivorans]|nr:hypothetical protein BASA81_002121 [Batrachochytrium salamandrivorans]